MAKRSAPVLSSEARADITSIIRYIAIESGVARARAVRARIDRAIETIAEMPNAGRLRHDLPDEPRMFVVRPWVIIYRLVSGGGVLVSRVLDGRMDIPRHLSEP